MNYFSRLGCAGLVLAGSCAHAVSPVDGWYAGLMVGGSYINNLNFNVNELFLVDNGTFTLHSGLNGGGQVGYRFCDNFRIEAELNFNTNRLQLLKIGDLTFKTHQTPPGLLNPFNTITISGYNSFEAIFGNIYYDFFYEGSPTNWVPYIGLGIGYAALQNRLSFFDAGFAIGNGFKESETAPIGQVILGLSYFYSDAVSFGLDFRYLTTNRIGLFDARINAETLTLNFNYAFDEPVVYK